MSGNFVSLRNLPRHGSAFVRVYRRALCSTALQTQELPYPRAAVAVSIARQVPAQSSSVADGGRRSTPPSQFEYLLVQRKNPPGAGTWSLPGGKINLGEMVLDAGKREVFEETGIRSDDLVWLNETAGYNDVIFAAGSDEGGGNVSASTNQPDVELDFHYVLTQLIALVPTRDSKNGGCGTIDGEKGLPCDLATQAGDDASALRWETVHRLASGEVEMVGFDVVEHLTRVESILARHLKTSDVT
eukprot:INCI14603.1.p1 GENE.INCI14603.1~~INCI14603.1.p1  ORF type:complete len:244 (-),score=48.14 INCI14603.1:625-1356(-)